MSRRDLIDPDARQPLDLLQQAIPGGFNTIPDIVERRTTVSGLLAAMEVPPNPNVTSEDQSVPGPDGAPDIKVRIYRPVDATGTLPGIYYIHGGGMILGDLDGEDAVAASICEHADAVVVSVEYRLAPEHPFPAGLDDAIAAIAHVGAHAADLGIDAARLGVCGDSAGGTLTAAACHSLSRAAKPLPALQLLLCPILDYSRRTGSRAELASGHLIDQDTLDHDLEHYAPNGADPEDERISPLRAADLGGMPPTIVHTAEFDPLRDEGKDYYDRLRQTGSALTYTCHPGMIHLFYGLGAVIPYARTAFEKMGAEIRAALRKSGVTE